MVQTDAMATVSAAELVRSFAACRDRATISPLFIANHGRTSHVLVAIEQYKRLSAGQSSAGEYTAAHPDDLMVVAQYSTSSVLVIDADLQIQFANNTAHAVTSREPGSLNGQALAEALPELADSLIMVHLRRTMSSKEPYTADLPSPFNDDAFVHIQTFAIGDRIVLILRDISDEVKRHRLADFKKSLLAAMALHGGIGYVRISPRGTIEQIGAPLCTILGLPAERLVNVPLVDLATTAARPELRATLDYVLRGAGPRRALTTLLSNDGQPIAMLTALVALHGAYGSEGAIVLATPVSAG